AAGKAAQQRRDTDAGRSGDLVHRRIQALLGENLPRSLDHPGAIAGRIDPQTASPIGSVSSHGHILRPKWNSRSSSVVEPCASAEADAPFISRRTREHHPVGPADRPGPDVSHGWRPEVISTQAEAGV